MEEMQKEFNNLYVKKLFPILKSLEKERQKKLNEFISYEILILIIAISLYFIISSFYTFSQTSLKIFMWVIALLMGFIFVKSSYDVKTMVKEKCKPYLEKLFGGIKWGTSITQKTLANSGLFDDMGGSSIGFYDTFSGSYKNVPYSIAEIRIGRNSWRLAILVPSNKKVSTATIVCRKQDILADQGENSGIVAVFYFIMSIIFTVLSVMMFMAKIYIYLSLIIVVFAIGFFYSFINSAFGRKVKQEKINLEDISFNKEFTVKSKNQVEARYLLTPAFMDRLLNLEKSFHTSIECSFFEDKILFSIHSNKDLFELGSLCTPLTDSKKAKEFFKELYSIYQMIEYFKLDEKTGI